MNDEQMKKNLCVHMETSENICSNGNIRKYMFIWKHQKVYVHMETSENMPTHKNMPTV